MFARSRLSLAIAAVLANPAAAQVDRPFTATFSGAPLAFVQNEGQWPEEFCFRVGRGPASAAILTRGFALNLVQGAGPGSEPGRGNVLRFDFESETYAGSPRGHGRRPGRYNFYLGSDPRNWRTGVRAWEELRFEEVWPGVDVVLHAGQGLFEYDLELAPGTDLGQAVIQVSGALSLALDAQGRLAIETEAGTLWHTLPVAWTESAGGELQPHECRFRVLGAGRFGFEAPPVPEGRMLVVDPGVIWSTFLGDMDQDIARAVAVAPNGEVLATGSTFSADFPKTVGAYDVSWNGGYDAFVTRVTPDGRALLFSTFLGGSGSEGGNGVAFHPDGSVFVAGETASVNFPVTGGAFDQTYNAGLDGFVAHLDQRGGILLQSTFLGSEGLERLMDLALDGSGRPVVCGLSSSGNFPTVPGGFDVSFGGGGGDAFLTRLAADLSALEFSTFLGGAGMESAVSLAIGSDGRITVGGWTRSLGFPTTAGAVDGTLAGTAPLQDGFVTRFEANGQALSWSTFLGGSAPDAVNGVASLPSGECVAVGQTESTDFLLGTSPAQAVHGGLEDAFVTRLSSSGTQLVNSTYFGGPEVDQANSVTHLPGGGVVVLGTTASQDLPMEPWVWDPVFGSHTGDGLTDAFVNRYEDDGDLSYSTYVGGGSDEAGLDIASDGQGGVLLCGETNSYSFPVTPGAFDTSYDFSSVPDGFLTHFEFIRFPFVYGSPTINSYGGWAFISTTGFPSLSGEGLTIWVDGAFSNSYGLFFWSSSPGAVPFAGGELLMQAPFQRGPVEQLGWLGSAGLELEIDPSMVGTTSYYQFWYADPDSPWGVGLSAGLEVLFYP